MIPEGTSVPPPDKLREECGVFGLWSPVGQNDAADEIYRGLLALQHRGQESAGITVGSDGMLQTEKGMGLISQVFTGDTLETLKGHMGIGHVRYSTAGAEDLEHAQPLEARGKLGSLAAAHNGTLVNADILRSLLEDGGVLFRTQGDTEVLLAMIARRSDRGLENAVTETVRDVAPGEVILIDQDGPRSVEQDLANNRATCVFEYIYFARPDSRLDGISVMDSRLAMGRELAREWDIEADLVCGVPDSGVPAALGFARESGIPYGMGFLKNHYVGRTFIHPDQAMRERAVSVKLTALEEEVKDKRVILIDDSIVRGTTSRRLVSLMRKAGARQVNFGVVSPPITSPCYFGIDTPVAEDLIAHGKDVQTVQDVLGADSLRYLSLPGLKKAMAKNDGFCLGCLTGTYPIPPHKLRG